MNTLWLALHPPFLVFKMKQMIVLDFDLKLGIDLGELASLFDKLEGEESIGIAFDQMTHYK